MAEEFEDSEKEIEVDLEKQEDESHIEILEKSKKEEDK